MAPQGSPGVPRGGRSQRSPVGIEFWPQVPPAQTDKGQDEPEASGRRETGAMEIHHQPQEPKYGPLREPSRTDITRPIRQDLSEWHDELEQSKEAARKQARQATSEDRVERSYEALDAGRSRMKEGQEGRRSEEGSHADRVEFSERARLLAAASDDGVRSDERQARVEELRSAHESGSLNTPERIDRAAAKMLSGF